MLPTMIKGCLALVTFRASIRRLQAFASVSFLLCTMALAIAAPAPYPVMLLTGQNNHDWKATTVELEKILKQGNRFEVTVVTTPPSSADAEEWSKCPLKFGAYRSVVMNWNDFGVKLTADKAVMPWTNDLVRYVENGGGLVVVHSASLENHPTYLNLAGMGWRSADFGDRITVSNDGEVQRTPRGQGPSTRHGAPFEWLVTFRAPDHPITKGLPPTWKHVQDELWHATRGPAQNLQVLATAFCPTTQTNEPVLWTVLPGKGRVVVTLMGHDAAAMRDDCFRTTLTRGCEWVITGGVTQPAPEPAPGVKAP
jgi:hypothetical protein